MKNTFKVFGVIALAVIIWFSMAGCPGPETAPGFEINPVPGTVTYQGIDTDGNTYTLKIMEKTGRAAYTPKNGDSYILTVTDSGIKISTGTVNVEVETSGKIELTLEPDKDKTTTFTVTVSSSGIINITGTITFTDGTTKKQEEPLEINPIDTNALTAEIQNADEAKAGVITASSASEVPTGRKWVTEDEWEALETVYKKAVETKANPSNQTTVNTAKTNLQAAITTFITAKKNGSGSTITLSGTITVKNNGKFIPYVVINPHTEDWSWQENQRVPLTMENTPWSIITKPLSKSTDIYFRVICYDNDKYENALFSFNVDEGQTVYNSNINNIAINKSVNLITVSGTLNFDYNGKVVPAISIEIYNKEGGGNTTILNAGNSTPWSMTIPSQAAETNTSITITGWDGPIPWAYDQLFGFWGIDFGVKVGNQDKTGIELKLITISGTINVTYKGNPVPNVWLHFDKVVDDNSLEWIRGQALYSPSSGSLWSVVIPAYTSNTEILIGVSGGQNEVWDGQLFSYKHGATITVMNTDVSGIALDLGDVTDD